MAGEQRQTKMYIYCIY